MTGLQGMPTTIDSPIRKRYLPIILFLLTVLLRLMLSSDRDIAATNSPYDEYWYISSATRWIYGGHYQHMSFAQLPLYAMWLKLVSLFGVPARLAIDLAWIAGCAYLGMAIARLCKQAWPGVLIYLFLCFHPYSIVEFDRALSETLLTVMTVYTMAGFIEIWNLHIEESVSTLRSMVVIITESVTFAVAYHTRKEGVVLLPPILILFACSLLYWKVWWSKGRRTLAYPLIIYPLLATIAIGTMLAGANYLRWGVFARYELAAPGFVRAIKDINAIDPGSPTPHHVTITALTRSKAYAVSPTFAELKFFFEGPPGQWLAKNTEQIPGVSGEIANGWFYWALRDAAAIAGWHKSATNAEYKYNMLADELETAFADGRLQKRSVPISFVDPDWRKWLADVPKAFFFLNRMVIDPNAVAPQLSITESALPNQYDEFVSIAGRRRSPLRAHIAGWLIAQEGSSISFGNGARSFSWQPIEGDIRPDVAGARSFRLVADRYELPTEIQIRNPEGEIKHISLAELKPGVVTSTDRIPAVTIGVDEISYLPYASKVNALLPAAIRIWYAVGQWMVAAGFIAMLCYGWKKKKSPATLIIVCVMATVLARTLMLALLDASSWNALQTRYIFPVVPCAAVFGTLGLWTLIDQIKRKLISPT